MFTKIKIRLNFFKKITKVFSLMLTISILFGCFSAENNASQKSTANELFSCGMHPNVIQEGAGNCPICGMNLTPVNVSLRDVAIKTSKSNKVLYYRAADDPFYVSAQPGKSQAGLDLISVYAGEETIGSIIKINPTIVQNIGVRTAKVMRRDLELHIRTIGRIDYDETATYDVQTKFAGWIEKVFINETGQKVNKGEALFEIYSPQLVTAQEEYLNTFRRLNRARHEKSIHAGNNLTQLLEVTRKRLEHFDISNNQIEKLEANQTVNRTITIKVPFPGIIEQKHIQTGMEVRPGMKLYSISDISKIWVFADIYEYDIPWVKAGSYATMTLAYAPQKQFNGQVEYIYPNVDPKMRTTKARLVFSNADNFLKPGMYVTINISTNVVKNALAVPSEAVMFSGERNLVFIDLGDGNFAPRYVTIGIESEDGFYEILDGLTDGEVVVTSAQFLLDSESKRQAMIARMLSEEKANRITKAPRQ